MTLRFVLCPRTPQLATYTITDRYSPRNQVKMLHRVNTGTWMPAWVPASTSVLSVLLLLCSMVQSTTGGYDGSMLNGLNILPSYTDYFNLNKVTTGLNTASVFIGGFFGPIFSGVMADRLGRRPTMFWGTMVTLVGIILQAASQNVAMFVVSRIILGWGGQIQGIAGAVYLSETFPSRWRAWGVGVGSFFFFGESYKYQMGVFTDELAP